MKLPALIDCRPYNEYCAGHIEGACSLPATQLFERMHELPKRDRALALCGGEQGLALAEGYLTGRGYEVAEKIIWDKELELKLRENDQLERGGCSRQLWQPAALWRRFTENIALENNIEPGAGLDIACGAGRDMVYLAMQGWQMTGIDRSEDSLHRVATLAGQAEVPVVTLQRNLETGSDPLQDFSDGSFDLITVGRYLHRPLFPVIKRLLKPAGVIIYQTFMQGCENTEIGRPRNPHFLLKPRELAAQFNDFEILTDEVEYLGDGRPVAAFVARKLPV